MTGPGLAALVALTGALGAPCRFAVEAGVRRRWPTITPVGTLLVNTSGSLALGVVTGLAMVRGLDPEVRTVLGTGFLGAYTTFSTYAYETIRVAVAGHRRVAVAYALGSVLASALAATAGLWITGAW